MKHWKTGFLLAAYLLFTMSLLYSQGSRPQNIDWPVYGGGPNGARYSSLTQINQSNVNQLQVAWTYDAGDGTGTLETNPIVVNGVLYGYTTAQKVFAVDAATGKQIWKFDSGTAGRGNNRGLSYWSSGADQRIFAPGQRYGEPVIRTAVARTAWRPCRYSDEAVGSAIDHAAGTS